jgi:hypothetical protein
MPKNQWKSGVKTICGSTETIEQRCGCIQACTDKAGVELPTIKYLRRDAAEVDITNAHLSTMLLVSVLLHWLCVSIRNDTAPSDIEGRRVSRARILFVCLSILKVTRSPSSAAHLIDARDGVLQRE